MTRVLAVRLDNAGDVLLAGPALRAVSAGCDELVLLAGPNGAAAGRMLEGVDEVVEWRCPWIDAEPAAVDPADIRSVTALLAGRRFDRALALTSFHQSPLPTALLLRMAGVPWVGAISDDYPGSLLDLRHRVDDMLPEAERALSLACAAGFALPATDDGALRVRRPLPDVSGLLPGAPYVVLHPGTSVPARAWPAERFTQAARLLEDCGHGVLVTGAPAERDLTAAVVAGSSATDLGGRTSWPELAAVLDGAAAVVVGNTGPAHLAAAVSTPVVSLFAPTVPAERWAPYRVPLVLLGDQDAVCRDTRVTRCPFEGHPCLTSVTAEDVLRAVEKLCGSPQPAHTGQPAEEV
ncbi:MAG TPA: glycosyltransferase family 9 protein [Nocardioidaceae bacterium]|nr:glycosyltransferase family 9 protein [Nocardioidaceae bacterium]